MELYHNIPPPCQTHNPQPATRNSEPATRNSEPTTRNSELGTRNFKLTTNHSLLDKLRQIAAGNRPRLNIHLRDNHFQESNHPHLNCIISLILRLPTTDYPSLGYQFVYCTLYRTQRTIYRGSKNLARHSWMGFNPIICQILY